MSGVQSLLEEIREAERSLERRYQKALVVNPDLDRTVVSFQANKSEPYHRWFKYKEGFSSSLVRYILRKTQLRDGCILDPFAGSGTALFVASEEGIDSLGIELLPPSAEMIAVKNLLRMCDKRSIPDAIRNFAASKIWERPGPTLPFRHVRITAGAFSDETQNALERYTYEVNCLPGNVLSRILRFAAMCVLESVSYTRKDGQYLRWDWRSGRCVGKKPVYKNEIFPFSIAIENKLNEIAEDIRGEGILPGLSSLLEGKIELSVGSCLDLMPSLYETSFDAIITSPPYCNRYDYTRTYALELAFLGAGEAEIRHLRQQMLSCTVENREKQGLDKTITPNVYERAHDAFESQTLLQMILRYLDACKDAGVLNNTGVPRMVRNYFRELAMVIFEGARVLKPGAPFVMVNDNVRYEGADIPVDLILSEFAQSAGLEVEVIWVLPRGKGNSSQQMGKFGRTELRKCVYIWRKAKD